MNPKHPKPRQSRKLTAKKADEALRRYTAEIKRRATRQWMGYSALSLLTVFLIMLLSGDRFKSILSVVGLRGLKNAESGIYADCSRKENQSNPLCYREASQTERDWKGLTERGSRFQLTE